MGWIAEYWQDVRRHLWALVIGGVGPALLTFADARGWVKDVPWWAYASWIAVGLIVAQAIAELEEVKTFVHELRGVRARLQGLIGWAHGLDVYDDRPEVEMWKADFTDWHGQTCEWLRQFHHAQWIAFEDGAAEIMGPGGTDAEEWWARVWPGTDLPRQPGPRDRSADQPRFRRRQPRPRRRSRLSVTAR